MAKLALDIVKLYGDYFGYIGLPFIPGSKEIPNYKANDFQDISILENDNYTNKKDILGRSLFDEIILDNISLDIARLNLSMQKTIVKTVVAGRAGTVKELISAQDYRITIKGLFYNFDSNKYPESQVEKLKEIYEKNTAIEIKSRLANIFEITKVVIESLSFEEQKQQNIQAYSIILVSDDDFTAILNES